MSGIHWHGITGMASQNGFDLIHNELKLDFYRITDFSEQSSVKIIISQLTKEQLPFAEVNLLHIKDEQKRKCYGKNFALQFSLCATIF